MAVPTAPMAATTVVWVAFAVRRAVLLSASFAGAAVSLASLAEAASFAGVSLANLAEAASFAGAVVSLANLAGNAASFAGAPVSLAEVSLAGASLAGAASGGERASLISHPVATLIRIQ